MMATFPSTALTAYHAADHHTNYNYTRLKGVSPMPNYNDVLHQFTAEASDFINNPDRLDRLLLDAEKTLRSIPTVGDTVSGLPVMIAMVKSWVKKEYEVQPKVLATMIGALLYLVKKKDLIPDNIPVVGLADDVAVLVAALKLIGPELNAYRQWRDNGRAV